MDGDPFVPVLEDGVGGRLMSIETEDSPGRKE